MTMTLYKIEKRWHAWAGYKNNETFCGREIFDIYSTRKVGRQSGPDGMIDHPQPPKQEMCVTCLLAMMRQ